MLRSSRLRRRKTGNAQEVNPMESVANLVDIMLVFSCGLMVSIVLNWNVDLANVTGIIDESQLIPLDDTEFITEDSSNLGGFESKGVVIQDPKTGIMYIVSKGK